MCVCSSCKIKVIPYFPGVTDRAEALLEADLSTKTNLG